MEISEIYRVKYMRSQWAYIGTLRNEKRFYLNDKVFFVVNTNEIAKGKIVGVELPPAENPEYIYKIQIPEELVKEAMNNDDSFFNGRITRKCGEIFSSLEEAKASAITHLDRSYELQKKEIEKYFNEWN